jgi:hypothetical protein
MMKRKSKGTDKQVAPKAAAPAQWVQDMHRYYDENGHYRAEDLHRVLGDPSKSVQVQASSDSPAVSRLFFNRP